MSTSWTFGPNGVYTATWAVTTASSGVPGTPQGTGKATNPQAAPVLTVTLTASGNPVASFSGDMLQQAIAQAAALGLSPGVPMPPPSGGDDTSVFVTALDALPTMTIYATPPSGGSSATFRYGTILLGSGTYQVGASEDIGNLGPFVSIIGPGHLACQIDYYGSGSCVEAHSTIKPTDDTFDDLEAFAGRLDGFTVDGTNAGSTAKLFDVGDFEDMVFGPDLWAQNATGASAWGVYFNNQVSWTESCYGRMVVRNCTNLVGFDVIDTGDTSFEYNDLTFKAYAWPDQKGVTLNNGATYSNGSLKVRANFLAGQSANSGALLVFGTSSGPNNRIAYSRLDLQAEVNGSGSYPPMTINVTSAYYSLVSNSGQMIFGDTWATSNISTTYPLGFDGNITGDTVLEGLNARGQPWGANLLQGWSMDPAGQASSGATPAIGALAVAKVMVPQSIYVQKIGCSVTAAANTPTASECFMVVYSSSGTLLGQTADLSTALGSSFTGDLLEAVATAFEVKGSPGTWIYVGMIYNGSGAPSLARGTAAVGSDNIGTAAGTYRFARTSATYTSPPSSVTPSNISTTEFAFFFCVA